MSADAQAAMVRELVREARMQETTGGPVAALVAALVAAYAHELK